MTDASLANAWASSKLSGESLDMLDRTTSDIITMITDHGHPPQTDTVRGVDRRLRICTNPARIPGTKAFIARQEEDERKEQEKRVRKAEEIQRVMDNSDPFADDAEKERVATLLDDDD